MTSKHHPNFDEKFKETLMKKLTANFLELIIICNFHHGKFSGYDITQYVLKQLNVLLSPGTVYSKLYAMEREGLLTSTLEFNKSMFTVTEKGLQLRRLLSGPDNPLACLTKTMKNET